MTEQASLILSKALTDPSARAATPMYCQRTLLHTRCVLLREHLLTLTYDSTMHTHPSLPSNSFYFCIPYLQLFLYF